MKTLKVTIKGTSPLLMHAYKGDTPKGFEKSSPEEQAEYHTYRNEKTRELYIPVENMHKALINAGRFSRGKGRASLQSEIAGCITLSPARIGLGLKEYDVSSMGVVIKATGGRVMRHRARIEDWGITFAVDYDENVITKKQIEEVITNCGVRVGLLDNRPEKKGPYGRFELVDAA